MACCHSSRHVHTGSSASASMPYPHKMLGGSLPGFQGMQLDPGAGPGQNHDAIRHPEAEDYVFHFPDGNASVARLLVRRLIPGRFQAQA